MGFPVPPRKPPASVFALAYSTADFPVKGLSPPSKATPEYQANLDVKQYRASSQDPSPLNPPNGTACTILEVPLRNIVPMHRTASIDYGVVIDGTTELVLDSGESKVLSKGDVLVQRGRVHSWRDITKEDDNGGILRIFFCLSAHRKGSPRG